MDKDLTPEEITQLKKERKEQKRKEKEARKKSAVCNQISF